VRSEERPLAEQRDNYNDSVQLFVNVRFDSSQ